MKGCIHLFKRMPKYLLLIVALAVLLLVFTVGNVFSQEGEEFRFLNDYGLGSGWMVYQNNDLTEATFIFQIAIHVQVDYATAGHVGYYQVVTSGESPKDDEWADAYIFKPGCMQSAPPRSVKIDLPFDPMADDTISYDVYFTRDKFDGTLEPLKSGPYRFEAFPAKNFLEAVQVDPTTVIVQYQPGVAEWLSHLYHNVFVDPAIDLLVGEGIIPEGDHDNVELVLNWSGSKIGDDIWYRIELEEPTSIELGVEYLTRFDDEITLILDGIEYTVPIELNNIFGYYGYTLYQHFGPFE